MELLNLLTENEKKQTRKQKTYLNFKKCISINLLIKMLLIMFIWKKKKKAEIKTVES